MEEKTERAYTPKEISLSLNIGDSTLRKWSIALEKNGYHFIRNEQSNRVYVEHDLVVLRHFQNLVQHYNMQLENAAKLVIDRFGKGAFDARTVSVPAKNEVEQRDFGRSNEMLEEIITKLDKQEQFNLELVRLNKELMEKLDKQQKYIDERLNERDKLLLESIREAQETKKMLVAAQEEKKKGFFARLFGK